MMAQQDWVRVSAEQAERHPLHGLGGWLRVVSLLVALTAMSGPLITVVIATKVFALPSAMLPAGMVLVALMALGTASAIVLAVLWFDRSPAFLRAYVELSALSIALDVAGDLLLRQWGPLPPPFERESTNLFAEVLMDGLLSAIPWWLLWRSRRYRITFLHEVRRDDPALISR
jgi:hypothetical protein